MADVRKLKDEAARALEKGRHRRAAELYAEVGLIEKEDPLWPHRAGEAFRRAGARDEAIAQLERSAEGYARQGFLLKAIAVAKMILELDAKRTGAQEMLSGLYARRDGGRPATASSAAAMSASPLASSARLSQDALPLADAGAPSIASARDDSPLPMGGAAATSSRRTAPPELPLPPPVIAPPPPQNAPALFDAPLDLSAPVALDDPSVVAPRPARPTRPPLVGAEDAFAPPAPPPGPMGLRFDMPPSAALPDPRSLLVGSHDRAIDEIPLHEVVPGAHASDNFEIHDAFAIPLDRPGQSGKLNDRSAGAEAADPFADWGDESPAAPLAMERAGGSDAAPPPIPAVAPPPIPAAASSARAAAPPPIPGGVGRVHTPRPTAEIFARVEDDPTEEEVAEAFGFPDVAAADGDIATPTAPPIEVPPALPEVPLFSSLDEPRLRHLIARARVQRPAAGEVIVRQDDAGDALFVVVRGQVEVTIRDTERPVAYLDEGSFFGELALLTDSRRMATVAAVGDDTEVIEIKREVIWELIEQEPDVLTILLRFFRDRLIERLVVSSPLFATFSKDHARGLAETFEFLELKPGAVLIEEGARAKGLFVLLCGECEVSSKDGGVLAHTGSGDLCGEMSLLSHGAAMATVKAKSRVWALGLPRARFQELILTHPPVLEYIHEVAEARREAVSRRLDQLV